MNSTRTRAALAGCLLAVAALAAAGLLIGSFPLSFSEILRDPGGLSARVFWQLRLPRTLMGLAGGWALGMAGGVYQTVFANPLASPDLTGVSSGASLGAATAIVLGAGGRLSVTLFSFAFGMAALAAVLGLVSAARLARTGSYLLAGVIVSSLAEAGLMVLKTLADPEGQLGAIESWTMGSLSAVTAQKIALPALLAAGCAALLWLVRKPILMLSLGESTARGLGLDPALWRALVLSLTTLMVAAVVSVCGAVAFVGLIAPHIAFFLGGRRGGPYLALCGLCGAAVLLAADLPARLLNLPLSIFTVAAAVPVLLVLLVRQGRGGEDDA